MTHSHLGEKNSYFNYVTMVSSYSDILSTCEGGRAGDGVRGGQREGAFWECVTYFKCFQCFTLAHITHAEEHSRQGRARVMS